MDANTAALLTALIGGVVTIVNGYFAYKSRESKVAAADSATSARISAAGAVTAQAETKRMLVNQVADNRTAIQKAANEARKSTRE